MLQYSQGIVDPQIDELITKWYTAKSDFFDLFDNKLIYEVPEEISFPLTSEAKEKRFLHFQDSLYDNYNYLGGLGNFFADLSVEEFFTNMTTSNHNIFYYDRTGAGHEIFIPSHNKVLKSLKNFDMDEEAIKYIQSKASMLMQEDKISGKLCFSIHPLDYLSISENNYNWRSCHALDGDYRTGNLNYMTDNTTIVCYLKSDKNTILPNFPENVVWNNKKWRVLLFFSDDRKLLFAGRPYPFNSDVGLDYVLQYFTQLKNNNTFTHWNQITSDDPMIAGKHYGSIIYDNDFTYQYNDLLYSSYYKPKYSIAENHINHIPYKGKVINYMIKKSKVMIGEPVKCIRCGEDIIEQNDLMLCLCCKRELYD